MTTKATSLPRFYSVDDVAEQLRLSSKSIRRLIESGQLHAHRFGRQLRMSEDDLAVFISMRRK
jgi:excisionase family DNA binding protein